MTPPELRLWSALRRRPEGLKFRRQHPFGPYVLDFFCDASKLAVEIDGEAHGRGDGPARDARRDAFLRRQGLSVLRVTAEEVRINLEGVVAQIGAAASFAPSTASRSPAPRGGGDT